MNGPVVLVVEDDAPMRRVLTVALQNEGYQVKAVGSGRRALEAFDAHVPDAILLDLGLPDMDGFHVARHVRRTHSVPIVVLSARSDEEQQIRMLDAGASDFVVKPFREGELMARMRAALRRNTLCGDRGEVIVGGLRLDTQQRRAFSGVVELKLTPTEFKLLHLLAQHADQVVTHKQLLREVWGESHLSALQYLRVFMNQLRAKLKLDPERPPRIVTALGVGYRLVGSDAI